MRITAMVQTLLRVQHHGVQGTNAQKYTVLHLKKVSENILNKQRSDEIRGTLLEKLFIKLTVY